MIFGMKKYKRIASLFLIFFSVLNFSCEKSDSGVNNLYSKTGTDAFISYSEITEEHINQIANDHNNFLSEIFANYDWTTSDHKSELSNQLEAVVQTYDFGVLNVDYNTQDSRLNENLTLLENTLSPESYEYIEEALVAAENIESYSSFDTKIDEIESLADKHINEVDDRLTVLITINIMRASAKFWLPLDMGGTGEGYSILEKFSLVNNEDFVITEKFWANVLGADGASAGVGFITVGLGLVSGPLGWGTLLVIGGGAAASSGWAALLECL